MTLATCSDSSSYFPALPTIADDLGVSIAKINLTITSYLVLQGLCKLASR